MSSRMSVQCVGSDAVSNWFTANSDHPYYSVWNGKTLMFSYNGTDDEVGLNRLIENIEAQKENNVSDVMQLRIHPDVDKNGYISDKTPYVASCFFRSTEAPPPQYSSVGRVPGVDYYTNAQIMEKLNAMESRINGVLEAEDEEEQQQQQQPENPLMGALSGILNHPQMQNLLVNALAGFIGNFLPKGEPTPTALAGVPDNQEAKAAQALSIIKQYDELYGDDLMKLAELAQNNNSQFNFLLTMLRK